MLHLTNMSNCPGVLEWFDHDPRQVREFLGQHRLDGLEVIFFGDQDAQSLPRESIQGIQDASFLFWFPGGAGLRASGVPGNSSPAVSPFPGAVSGLEPGTGAFRPREGAQLLRRRAGK